MSSKRLLHVLSCALVAAAVTAGTYVVDRHYETAAQSEQALRWARQVATQADSLALESRERNPNQDALGWAARLLSQGGDSRILSVTKVHGEISNPTPETYELDAEKGVFEYSKFIDFQENAGVKIRLSTGPVGFLGATGPFTNDFCIGTLFAFVFLIGFAYTGALFGFKKDRLLRERVLSWIVDSKSTLTQLGVHIRELMKNSASLAQAARASQITVNELRGKIHHELTDLREKRRDTPSQLKTAQRAEVLARHIASTISKTHPQGSLPAMSVELHRLVLDMLRRQGELEARIKELEMTLEPIATHVDLAFHSFDTVDGTTAEISSRSRKTTETLLDQARLIRDLRDGTTG